MEGKSKNIMDTMPPLPPAGKKDSKSSNKPDKSLLAAGQHDHRLVIPAESSNSQPSKQGTEVSTSKLSEYDVSLTKTPVSPPDKKKPVIPEVRNGGNSLYSRFLKTLYQKKQLVAPKLPKSQNSIRTGLDFISSSHVIPIDASNSLMPHLAQSTRLLPNSQAQHDSSRQLWMGCLFATLHPDDDLYDIAGEQLLEQQKSVIKRVMLSLLLTDAASGDQKENHFTRLTEHPLVALISCGQRIGLEFDNIETARQFQSFLLTGDPAANLAQQVNSIAFKNDQGRRPIQPRQPDSPAGIFKRISTHDQRFRHDHWEEIKAIAAPGAFGMNFPMGGVGNTVESGKRIHRIGYEGLFDEDQQQWGTLLVKLNTDPVSGTARVMIGVEGTAPFKSNHLGADHGIIASIKSYFGNISDTSVTGQDKGKKHGVMDSMGGTCASVNAHQLNLIQNAWEVSRALPSEGELAAYDELLQTTCHRERQEILEQYFLNT